MSLKVIGEEADLQVFHDLFLVREADESGELDYTGLNLEAVCPLEGRNQRDYWGYHTKLELERAGFFETSIEMTIYSDGNILKFAWNVSRRYPTLSFILRDFEMVDGVIFILYLKNGENINHYRYDLEPVYVTPVYETPEHGRRQIEWDTEHQYWAYATDDGETEPIPILQSGDMHPDQFARLITYDLLDEQDPFQDNASMYAEQQVEGYQDDSDEESESSEESEPELVPEVTISPFQGELKPDVVCSICLLTPSNAQLISCGHYYCQLCISTWLDQPDSSRRCPVCRRVVA